MNKKQLYNLYWNKKLSALKISQILGKSKLTILKFMKKFAILRRKCGRIPVKINSKKLYDLYIKKQLSTHRIAKIYKCGQSYIRKILDVYNIKIRDREQARLIQFKKKETKEKMSRASSLRWSDFEYQKKMSLIRGGTGIPYENSEYPQKFYEIREKILKRDNYICQECFKYGNNVHHIDYNKNNNLENNLITLCVKCNTKANFNKNICQKHYKEVVSNV